MTDMRIYFSWIAILRC